MQPARPYRLEVPGTSLVQRCEHLTVAAREGETLAQRMKAEVRIYEGEKFGEDDQGVGLKLGLEGFPRV